MWRRRGVDNTIIAIRRSPIPWQQRSYHSLGYPPWQQQDFPRPCIFHQASCNVRQFCIWNMFGMAGKERGISVHISHRHSPLCFWHFCRLSASDKLLDNYLRQMLGIFWADHMYCTKITWSGTPQQPSQRAEYRPRPGTFAPPSRKAWWLGKTWDM